MIIAVTDRKSCERPFLEQIERIAEAGPDLVILREKDLAENEYLGLAEECLGICSDRGVAFSVHSFTDVPVSLGTDRIHLPMGILRTYTGRSSVGASVHSVEEAEEAAALGADYVIFGHVFGTSCKPGLEPRGPELLKEVCGRSEIPVYAIGGISPDNVKSVMDCGASGVCVMSSLMGSDDPSSLIGELRRRMASD